MNKSEWLSPTGISAIATALFAFAAFFKDTILQWWNRPKLKAALQRKPPDTSLIYSIGERPLLYFRLKVWNKGRTAAEKVEVYAKNLQKTDGKTFENINDFLPMNLTWSHLPQNENIYMPTIPPNTFKHCDVACVQEAPFSIGSSMWNIVVNTNMLFKDNSELNERSKYIVLSKRITANNFENYLPKGEYLLTLELSAANAKPKEIKILVVNNDIYFEEQDDLLTKGSYLKIN